MIRFPLPLFLGIFGLACNPIDVGDDDTGTDPCDACGDEGDDDTAPVDDDDTSEPDPSDDSDTRLEDCLSGGNLAIGADAWFVNDGTVLYLDLELADSYSELGESWHEDITSTTVIDGWAIWCVSTDSSTDAARWDIDFPDGTNVCEGYGNTATLLTSTFATADEHSYWDVAPYSFQWTEGSSTYQGCSAAANGD